MLTVLKNNASAVDFYTRKLRYTVDETSPSRCGEEAVHEILSKALHPASIAVKERIAEAFAEGRIPTALLEAPGAYARLPAPAAAAPASSSTAPGVAAHAPAAAAGGAEAGAGAAAVSESKAVGGAGAAASAVD